MIPLPVHTHLMTVCPVSGRVECPDDIKSGGKSPSAGSLHQKGDIARVIVLIASDNIEHHTSEHLLHGRVPQVQLLDDGKRLFITVFTCRIEVVVPKCAERLHMNLLSGIDSIEPAGHEMRPPVFLQKTT